MIFCDTHTHLYLPEFDTDRADSIEAAIAAGVKYMFLPNIDQTSVDPMLAISREFPRSLFPMLGLHPTSVKANANEELEKVLSRYPEECYVAIGEIGIDLYWDKTFLAEQIEVLRRQFDFALEKNLPLVIHSRDSFHEILKVMDEYKSSHLRGIFHAFSGSYETAKIILSRGFLLGIGGVLTYKNAKLPEVIAKVGLEHLVLETDSPYLTPVPKRGQRNESANIPLIAAKIAEIKGVSLEEVAQRTSSNALTLFNIKN